MSVKVKVEPRPDYYVLGGALKSTAPSYVEREADTLLLDNIRRGEFCYVLTPRQMGKTSLMVRTSSTLRESAVRTVIIDLTQLGTKISVEQWYLGQIMRIAKDLKLQTGYLSWWNQQSHLGYVQRFITFLTDVALIEIQDPIVIFVDEIDTTLNLSFSDDYFAAIRSLYNQRSSNQLLDRLTFVLLGVASPSDLIQDATRTPFNIGIRIPLTDFTDVEASVLLPGLAPDHDSAEQLLKQVLFWTSGHPYLSQKTCKEVANWAGSSWDAKQVPLIVNEMVRRLFFSEQGRNQDFNMQFVRDRILESGGCVPMLQLYRRIRGGATVIDDELDSIRVALKLSGLVLSTDSRLLRVRNRIYDRAFDDVWIEQEVQKRSSDPYGPSQSAEFKYDAFVSYSHRDGDWVVRILVPSLRKAGIRIFSDLELLPGEEWSRALDDGFAQSRNIVLVMSPDYFVSDYAQLEVERALRLLDDATSKRRVIPLLLRSVDLPPILSRLQYIDFRSERGGGPAMSRLLGALGADEIASIGSQLPEPVRKDYDTHIIRRLLEDALHLEDLNGFVYDYFRPTRPRLDRVGTKKGKIQELIEAVDEGGEMDRLLDLMARNYPQEYKRYADLLLRQAS